MCVCVGGCMYVCEGVCVCVCVCVCCSMGKRRLPPDKVQEFFSCFLSALEYLLTD